MDLPLREALLATDLFEGVAPEVLAPLLDGRRVRICPPGEVLITAGELRRELHVVLEGRLSVHLEGPTAPPVAIIEAGASVGELSIIDGEPGSAYVVVAEPAELLGISDDEFWNLIASSRAFARNLLQGLSSRLRANNRTVTTESRRRRTFEHAAMNDKLCEVYNRAWLERELPRICAAAQCDGGDLALAVVDIDHFKRFNDQHGHQAGDHVLRAVATTLRDHLRGDDVIARYGGEEFVIVLHDAPPEAAQKAGHRLRRTIEGLELDGLPPVRISMGVTTFVSGDTPKSLVARADAALYRAKREGRNRVCMAGLDKAAAA